MNTDTPRLPRNAYSAAEPVSPDVAPRMLSVWPRWASTYSNTCPRNCMAMSLKASVGPSDRPSSARPGRKGLTGAICGKTSGPYAACVMRARSADGMSVMNKPSTRAARSAYSRSRQDSRVTASSVGSVSGSVKPPSGASPSRRMSQKACGAMPPRVDKYFN